MLTFSSPGSIDRIIAEKAAVAGDGLLDGVKIDVYNKVEIINDGRAGAFLRTIQGLSAPLFLHFSTTNMDDPCEKVAELLSLWLQECGETPNRAWRERLSKSPETWWQAILHRRIKMF